MDINGFFTQKGLLLAAKLAAGSTLQYTRACAGAAETALTASALSQIKQTLSMGHPRRDGVTAVIPVTLEAGQAGSAYTLREVGLYAQDPDQGEILYKVYRLTEPVSVNPTSRLVLRFYLEETVSQDLNVTVVRASAGLLTEADLDPIRATLDKTSVFSRTVGVAAADLAAYITSLPRLLTENLTIEVTAGTSDGITLSNFYGPGQLTLKARDGADVTLYGLTISSCAAPIAIQSLTISGNGSNRYYLVNISQARYVGFSGCTIDGAGRTFNMQVGVYANLGSFIYLSGCAVKNFYAGLAAARDSMATVHNCTAEGNSGGLRSGYGGGGGIIAVSGSTDIAFGGGSNSRDGSIIIQPNGAVLQ